MESIRFEFACKRCGQLRHVTIADNTEDACVRTADEERKNDCPKCERDRNTSTESMGQTYRKLG